MNLKSYKVVLFNIFGLSFVGIGLSYGLIQPLFTNDMSKLTYVSAALVALNVALSIYYTLNPLPWIVAYMKNIKEDLLYLGLLGTFIGFIIIVGSMVAALDANNSTMSNNDFAISILKLVAGGMRTAFNPSAIGLVGYIWTRRLLYFMKG